MSIFVCINNLSAQKKEPLDSIGLVEKKLIGKEVSGLFFYSNSVTLLLDKDSLNKLIDFSISKNIPISVCRNSLLSRNLPEDIHPKIKVSGLGKLIEGVLKNKKTLVIGTLWKNLSLISFQEIKINSIKEKSFTIW